MDSGGQYFFVSDVHLGSAYDLDGSRERAFVSFLRSLPEDTKALYLLGDIFDFWIEYRDVIPKGFSRVFGEFARLADAGVKITFFKGNHDYWGKDYFKKEFGFRIIDETHIIEEINGLNICMGHGDGIGLNSTYKKMVFAMFRSRFCIKLLKMLHPSSIFNFAKAWSKSSRKKNLQTPYKFAGKEDSLYKFVNELGRNRKIDFFIFGHIHDRAETDVESGGKLFVLDDWGDGGYYLNLSGIYMSGRSFPKIDQ